MTGMESPRRELGQQVIAVYKLVKGCGELALSLVLAIVVVSGAADASSLAMILRHHFSDAWSLRLGELLSVRHIELTGLALVLDGLLALVEGWALRKSFWWGPWLVVVATGVLVPFEIIAVVRHVRLTRLAVLVVNLGIVAFLGRKALAERRRP
jgi:uncharacterized membrane protein (DUF2068 family)